VKVAELVSLPNRQLNDTALINAVGISTAEKEKKYISQQTVPLVIT
tara:strand:+ start:317 stop:454 length:138 start_codon:yes stop_codon:yes gene_type:complete